VHACSVSKLLLWDQHLSIRAFPIGVYMFTIVFPPTTALRLRSFLNDLLGGAALWAASADAGKRALLPPQRHFPAGLPSRS
jgi:hypothetical protein